MFVKYAKRCNAYAKPNPINASLALTIPKQMSCQPTVSSIKAVILNHNAHLLQHTVLLATLPEPPLLPHLRPRNRLHTRRLRMIRLLAPPLASRLNIPSGRTATTQSHLYQPRENRKRARNPHEHEKRRPNLCANIQFRLFSDRVTEDDEHDGCDDGCDCDDERVEEGEDCDGEREPAGEDGEGHEEDENEG
jgi:hypothetical protein